MGPSPRCEPPAAQVPPRHGPPRPAHKRGRSAAARALPWQQSQQSGKPPRPHQRFTREDIKRIKERGPRLADLVIDEEIDHALKGADDEPKTVTFVPDGVFGDRVEQRNGGAPEPKWGSMEKLAPNLFIEGLKRRNWTHPHYQADAPKWHIEIWSNPGTMLPPARWNGYRCVVRQEGESQPFWVSMPQAGAPSQLRDYLSGGSHGAHWNECAPSSAALPPCGQWIIDAATCAHGCRSQSCVLYATCSG